MKFEAVRFGDLFEFIRNGMNVRQDKSGDGLPITRIETISVGVVDSTRVGFADLREEDCRQWLLQPGDILFSHINSVEHVGKCAIYEGNPEKLVHGMNLLCLRCDRRQILPVFAKLLIRSPDFRRKISNFINKAVNQASISITNLKKVFVDLPSLSEQQRIATILDQADALRAKRRQALAKLDTLIQSLFLDLFGDPRTNPKGFNTRPLGDLIKVKSGDSIAVSQLTSDGKYPVYGGNGINGYHEQFMFEFPTIVIGRVGVYCGSVFVTDKPSWVTDNALFVEKHSHELKLPYLAAALRFANFNQYAGRAAQPLISGSRIYPVSILVPPTELQDDFAKRLQATERLKAKQQVSQTKLESLFASLQDRAFRGET